MRAGGDATVERAQPKRSVLTGWFRHRAEKFLSSSVIPLRLRTALRSAVDQRGREGQTHWATSSPGVTYTTGRHKLSVKFKSGVKTTSSAETKHRAVIFEWD